jgi:hypothetical protein
MSDQIAEHIDTASEALRAALHLGAVTPEYPSDLAARAGNLVDLLGKLAQITLRLARSAEAAPTSFDLGSDDHAAAAEHTAAAHNALLTAVEQIESAHRETNDAFSALSHLKIS